MSNTELTFLEIYHPAFRRGYQDGRYFYFYKAIRLTDQYIVEGMLNIANNVENQQDAEEMYYAIGFVFGLMSACVLPFQKGEEDAKAVEEAFLQEVREKYDGSGQRLAGAIRCHWDRLDQFAQELDATTFVRMLKRGQKLHSFEDQAE
jgi:hypothetical protein